MCFAGWFAIASTIGDENQSELFMSLSDKEEHLALVLRTLDIEEGCWQKFLEGFASECASGQMSFDRRVMVLKQLWQSLSPHEARLDGSFEYDSHCPLCCEPSIGAVAARRQTGDLPLIYGACDSCGLGILLQAEVESSTYHRPEYYLRRDHDRAGYENYLAEQNYRETKGRRLIEWMLSHAARPLQSMLEIGSGFGFTRAAAEKLGIATIGVDLNPYAAQIAQAIYGFDTITGTLAEALETKAITACFPDVILYQFVLEHLEDPTAELRIASKTLSQGSLLVLVVPNMQSVEREIFGASYRSFRRDHLWLFSPDSLKILLENADLRIIAMKSECNVGLLHSFLNEEELYQLNTGCRAADLLVIAEKHEVSIRHYS